MVLARITAMAYNRLVDADLDAQNPRTLNRDIPTGRISILQVRILTMVCAFGFVMACYPLNALAFKLSPLALIIVFFYSHTKRFTWTSHLFLGLALGVAPVGAWVAVTSQLAVEPFLLTGAVICFLAGFDILYATQDEAFDKKVGLHSWVTRWGIANSVRASRLFHAGMLGFLTIFGVQAGFSYGYYIGMVFIAAALIYQHLRAYTLENNGGEIKFTLSSRMMGLNGWIAVIYLAVVAGVVWL
jgi:4-hydroxybenzoate polyprenyltransferase